MPFVDQGAIHDGAVVPSKRGLKIRNETGSALAAGDLVYLSGWDETYKAFEVTKADADAAGRQATYILRAALANNTVGKAYKTLRLRNVNTNGATVGDKVYLSATAGGWTLTAPAGIQQVVGRVAVVSATVGEIEFDIESHIVESLGGTAVGDVFDSVFKVVDNGDPTKKMAFQVSGVTAGQTRTLTVPDRNITIGADVHDNVFRIQDSADPTKQIAFEASGVTAGQTRTITAPDRDVNLEYVTRRAFVTIPFASVRTLNATPYTLIAAPGAGKFVQVESIHWWLDYGTATYDAAAVGDTLEAKYTNGAGAAVVDAVAGNAIGAAAADYHTVVQAVPEVVPVANAAIVAHVNVGEWYAAAGDSPLKAEIVYRVLDLEPAA